MSKSPDLVTVNGFKMERKVALVFIEMLDVLQLIYSDMERGHSINPYEHKARVGDVITHALKGAQ